MTELVLVHPGAQHGIYGALGDTLTALEPPPWCRMIGANLRDGGASVQIIDQEALGLDAATVADLVEVEAPRLVLIVVAGHQPSASTQQMTAAGAVARAIKDRNPRRMVMMCGNHPSALPERTLVEEVVDYVAVGEGVRTIAAYLAGAPRPDVPGLVWRDRWRLGAEVVRNAPAELVEDLDANLRGDAWDLLPMDRYRAHNWHGFTGPRKPYASIYTTLGCPYKCSFCMINTMFDANRYRRRSPASVADEVQLLHDYYGVRSLKLADEMFVLNEAHYLGVARELARRGLGEDLNIWAYARVDTVRSENLAALRAGGVRWLALGIESASAHVRDGANKRLRRDDIVDVVRTVQRAGISVVGNFMFGLRDDTCETMRETLDLARRCLPEWANFYACHAYPGSKLYDQALRESWTLPATWRGYSQHNDESRPLDTEHVSGSEVLRFRDAAFREYFAAGDYQAMLRAKFGPGAVGEVERMLEYRLERKFA